MPETFPAENSAGPTTALDDPPQPPGTPPGAVASGTPEPQHKHVALVATIVLAVLAVALLATAVYLVVSARSTGSVKTSAANRAPYESAMRKAGVTADYPSEPVMLVDVKPSGSHAFSATFSADEIAALLNTFTYDSNAVGVEGSLRDITLTVPQPGVVHITGIARANGGTYRGAVTMPLSFSDGRITTTGVTRLDVMGIAGSEGQRALVGGALLDYFNAYIAAAPGLRIDSTSIGAGGVTVTGTAPDSLAFP